MFNKKMMQIILAFSTLLGLVAATPLLAQQPSAALKEEFPELSTFFDAFKVTHGAMLQKVVSISESPSTADSRNHLAHTLKMRSEMTMHQMMSMPSEGKMAPFGKLELEATAELVEMFESKHNPSSVRNAFSNVPGLSRAAVRVIEQGRSFQTRLFDIYADKGLTAKRDAVNAAINDYLKDQSAVSDQAKDPTLLDAYPYDTAFKTAFPEFNGLNWTTQWLEFAALQALMLKGSDPKFDDSVSTAIKRFNTKVNGVSMSSIPTEMPMAPVIAPLLYHQHPRAAIILDNLNMFEVGVADILVHPGVKDKGRAMQQVVKEFTDSSNLLNNHDYLYWALRGGLFNQGGPALGAPLSKSERNRSRAEMDMQHAMTMSSP